MRFASWRLTLAAALLFCGFVYGQNDAAIPAPDGIEMRIDPHVALLEIVPPKSIQQSPAAIDLINRLMRKHVLLLRHPTLVAQVLNTAEIAKLPIGQQPGAAGKLAKAIRIRIIPDTNVIELAIDPDIAGGGAGAIAEALVNQHLDNQKLISQNAMLERSVMLNNMKTRYQFRKDELGRDLREKAVRLSIDGMGTPGRLSAKEVELTNLLQMSFELERKKNEATGESAKTIDAQRKTVQERIDSAKADLGDLTNAMNQYLSLKDDETTTRELLKQVNHQLEQISQSVNQATLEIRWLCRPSKG